MPTSARVLAPADVQRMLSHVEQRRTAVRDTCIILLSFHAGLRACEIGGLDWSMVTIKGTAAAGHIAVAGSIAKNGRQRMVPLTPVLARALRHLHRANKPSLNDPIIRSARGGHMTPRSIVNWFAQLYDSLGYVGCSSHSGRRSFITQSARLVAKVGGSLKDVQELAGHSALTTTERYIEGDREAQRKLIRMLA